MEKIPGFSEILIDQPCCRTPGIWIGIKFEIFFGYIIPIPPEYSEINISPAQK